MLFVFCATHKGECSRIFTQLYNDNTKSLFTDHFPLQWGVNSRTAVTGSLSQLAELKKTDQWMIHLFELVLFSEPVDPVHWSGWFIYESEFSLLIESSGCSSSWVNGLNFSLFFAQSCFISEEDSKYSACVLWITFKLLILEQKSHGKSLWNVIVWKMHVEFKENLYFFVPKEKVCTIILWFKFLFSCSFQSWLFIVNKCVHNEKCYTEVLYWVVYVSI